MRVLLSIKPTHAQNILSGLKTFEFRRRVFARDDVHSALIYCTKPVGMIVGEFEIVDVIKDSPSRLWAKTKCGSGITREYFDRYFSGTNVGYALRIGVVHAFDCHVAPDSIVDNFTAPQSFRYITNAASGSLKWEADPITES